MPQYQYDRLSAQDNAFLLWETTNLHMHVASTMLLEAGPLRTEDGGIDVDAIKRATRAVLHRIPRYRQRLEWIPGFNHAVWVDDEHFDLDYHIRHTSLPRPGSDAQLKQVSARVMAQQLDRERPLWETWVVEGLEGDRFALITKIHHCMIDGSSGVDVASILFSTTRESEIAEPARFIPRPAPTGAELWREEVGRTLSLPFRAFQGLRQFRRETGDLSKQISDRLRALGSLSIPDASETPINGRVGPHRAFDWLTMDLADMKAVKNAFDCTVNDAVLTTVTGAFRAYLISRQVRPKEIHFQIQAPVSMRGSDEKGELGNRVSSWTVPLPIGEDDPRDQLEAIHEVTRELKSSKSALGIETINTIAEWTTSSLLSLGAQAAQGKTNSIITNVPGPQFPLYILGAEQLGIYPQVPLLPGVGLGIALMSYNGKLCWGFNADPEMVPDLPVFVKMLEKSFRRLAEAGGVTLSDAATRRDTKSAASAKPAGASATPPPAAGS